MTNITLFHAMGWSLLHLFWQGALVAVLLACALGLLRRRSPQSRYVAACSALALMMILPAITFFYLVANSHRDSKAITNITTAEGAEPSLPKGFDQISNPLIEQAVIALDRSMHWVLLTWFAGVALFMGRLSAGMIVARRMKSAISQPVPVDLQQRFQELHHRLGITRPVKLIQSAVVQVPTVIGWLRPVVLMPIGCLTGLSIIQIDAVLAHELAHIRRHDYLINVLQSVIESLLFYHPAVWWISRQVRREREHCCDDFAVMVSGDSFTYAKALSFLEERRASAPAVVLGLNGGILTMRIRRLLEGREMPLSLE